jgi:cell wall-associated NlpC family hydrolase
LIVTSFNNTVAQQRAWAEEIQHSEGRMKYITGYLDTVSGEKEKEVLGATFKISYDNGKTFGKTYVSPITSPHGPIELADGSIGYVSSDYIKVDALNGQKGFVTGSVVNVREGASVDYKVIGSVTYGQSVDVTGSENGWFSIAYNGVTGYVCGEYINFEQLAEPTPADKLLTEARTHLGKPYVYGASGPYSFDCSGFTSYVYRQLGYNLNRTAAGQYSNGVYVSKDQLKPGDLVMFGRGYINHVGIYIGDNQFIHAENGRTGVVITSLSASYYASSYVGARRIL